MTIDKIIQAATADLKESNDRAEKIERNRRIEAEIERRRLMRHGISDADWQEGLNAEYQAQIKLQSMFGDN